jgi:hypothetical protein
MKNIKILLHLIYIVSIGFVVFYLSVITWKLHEKNELEKINAQKLQSIQLWQKSISWDIQDIEEELKQWVAE